MSGSYMLDIEDLHVKIGEREVLHDINLHIGEGESTSLWARTVRERPPFSGQ